MAIGADYRPAAVYLPEAQGEILKRTLRIEVVRYSRSSTVIRDEHPEAHLAHEKANSEASLRMSPSVGRRKTSQTVLTGAKENHPRRTTRLLSFLKQLMQG